MKHFLSSLFILTTFSVFSQTIPYAGSSGAIVTVCEWDDAVEINTTIGWTAYQTLDNTYNGIVDSTICLALKADLDYGGFSFPLNAFDTSRALYIQADLTPANKIPFNADRIYQVYDNLFNGIVNLDLGIDCPDLICSGIILGIEIPDSTFTETTTRWQFINASAIDYGFCIPTEKFESQFLTDYILKYTFNNPTPTDTLKRYPSESLELVYETTLITDLTNSDGYYDGSTYVIPAYEIMNLNTGLLKYDDPFYPSTDHFDFIDVSPNPNPAPVTSIDILIDDFYTLLTQPYVQLRGGYVDGDTLRHEVNLINNGGNFCLSIAEMIFTGNTNYIFNSGKLEMYSPLSCLMFKEGAAIKIAENGNLNYGNNGVGVLGLGSGGTIEIGKNATMQINNRISLITNPNSTFSEDIYMNLNAGSQLIFGDGASITNDAKSPSGAHLCIYMNGGLLNTDALSADSRRLIRLIYPNTSADKNKEINIFPNPVTQTFTAEIQSDESKTGLIQITNMLGVVQMQKNIVLTPGLNAIKLDVSSLENQVYLVNLICDSDFRVKEIIKQ